MAKDTVYLNGQFMAKNNAKISPLDRGFLFAMCQDLASTSTINAVDSKRLYVVTQPDQRWRKCHIKSTSLLANVMHYQHSQDLHKDETLLYNEQQEITQASTSNVFVIKDSVIKTPPLDQQILPGITRAMVIDMLQRHNQMQIIEQTISLHDARQADEIWLTSSSKQISPVLTLDGNLVGKGQIGPLCQIAQQIFDQHKFDY